ncbi:MFS transporter [Paenibacillus sp. WLX1005]|uniref:MFS transporter n=1 Tax=Paenibacillus sp. WLX1005 TaxID=3243766 RepID=UPI0039844ED6
MKRRRALGVNRLNMQKRRYSMYRSHLHIATVEGIPSTIFSTLLGGPFLTGFLLYLGANSGQIGFVIALTTLVNVAQIIIAFLLQRLNTRKWVLVLFTILQRTLWGATGLVPFLFDKSVWVNWFIILYVAAFLCNAVIGVVWASLIGDIVPGRLRGRYFGIRNTILNALGSLTLFVGGILLDQVPGGMGFLWLYMIVWTCAVINIVIILFYPDAPFERSTETKFVPMLRQPLYDGPFIKASLFLAAWLLMQTLVVPLYSYVMLEVLKVSYSVTTIMTVVQTIFMMLGFYFWGNLNARFSNKTLLYWTLPFIAAACMAWGLLAFVPVIVGLLIIHMLLGIGIGGFNQLSFNFIIGDTPKNARPMFIAVYSGITGFASFIGPLLGGQIFEWLKPFPFWVQAFGFQMLVGLLLLLLAVTAGRRVLKAPAAVPIQQYREIEI